MAASSVIAEKESVLIRWRSGKYVQTNVSGLKFDPSPAPRLLPYLDASPSLVSSELPRLETPQAGRSGAERG